MTAPEEPNPFVALWANATEQTERADLIRGIRIDPAILAILRIIDEEGDFPEFVPAPTTTRITMIPSRPPSDTST